MTLNEQEFARRYAAMRQIAVSEYQRTVTDGAPEGMTFSDTEREVFVTGFIAGFVYSQNLARGDD